MSHFNLMFVLAEDLSNGKEKFELDAEAIVDEAREQRE